MGSIGGHIFDDNFGLKCCTVSENSGEYFVLDFALNKNSNNFNNK